MTDRKKIRAAIREARRNIPKNYARQASLKFAERIAGFDAYQNATTIAAYLPFDGEADAMPLMERALLEKKAVFVPIIVAKDQPLKFAAWSKETTFKKNRFNILEPEVPTEEWIEGSELDCVIVPLVAFDEACQRIGVGGGFYDRTFAYLKKDPSANTKLIGLAYELQKLDSIAAAEWDVPLHAVATELAVYRRPE